MAGAMIPQGHKDLKVYRLAMRIFEESKSFARDERYSLTDQIRRSSRSVCANVVEGYGKKLYPSMFVSKMADADAEATETHVWLDFALDCGYLSEECHRELVAGCEEVGRMLGSMIAHPEKFTHPEP